MAQASSREHDVRQAAVDLLIATNQFDDVYHYSAPEDRGRAAGDLRAALVQPIGGADSIEWDDVTAGVPLCRHTFHVVVMARHEDPVVRDRMADQLIAIVRNAIDGKSLAGLTFGQATTVVNYTWLPEKPPERQIRCVVQASYVVPGWNEFNTTD